MNDVSVKERLKKLFSFTHKHNGSSVSQTAFCVDKEAEKKNSPL